MATADTTIDLRERRLRRHVPKGRALHLVDIENLAGGSAAPTGAVRDALRSYERVVRFGADDHRVVAGGRHVVYPVRDRWPGAAVRPARGVDGADRVLVGWARPSEVVGRYDRVVVASGDHAFVDLVIELDAFGLEVGVVSRPEALSRRLERVAPVVWLLEPLVATAA
jgi:hypothetical protein